MIRASAAVSRWCSDRIEENLEHQPRSLSLVVNGHVLATQEVNSAVSRLELDLNIGGPIELIEIISEQGFCLFGLPVDEQPPEVSPEIYRLVQLRGGRTVEAWLRFTSMGPRIETLYCDPALAALSDEAVEDRPRREGEPAIRLSQRDSAGAGSSRPSRGFHISTAILSGYEGDDLNMQARLSIQAHRPLPPLLLPPRSSPEIPKAALVLPPSAQSAIPARSRRFGFDSSRSSFAARALL